MAGLQPTDFDVRLGGRLKLGREGAGIKRKEMAEAIGVSAAQLLKYESGRNRTPASIVQAAARRLGVSVLYLFDPEPMAASAAEMTDASAVPTRTKKHRPP